MGREEKISQEALPGTEKPLRLLGYSVPLGLTPRGLRIGSKTLCDAQEFGIIRLRGELVRFRGFPLRRVDASGGDGPGLHVRADPGLHDGHGITRKSGQIAR